MIHEKAFEFIEKLIDNTKENKMEWKTFSTYKGKRSLIDELENGYGGFDYGVNSIRQEQSYYIKYQGGYIFFFEIYHGDPDVTSPELDTLAVMVKLNNVIPLQNITDYNSIEVQKKLRTLKIVIEHKIEMKYNLPNALYKYMDAVINGECDNSDN